MIDVAMLEKIGRAGGLRGAYLAGEALPPRLDEIFFRMVDGWAPRSPAYGEELSRLEAGVIRGDCVSPLLIQGDIVYIDRELSPQPGDLVSFAMSRRLADAQNADPPPGQSPTWRAGDRWIKLLVPYRGIDMLHERHGGSVTTTFAACESPDGTPILHPVRNIRRNGRLLFTPDTFCGQIGLNATSTLASATYAGTYTISTPSTGGGDYDVVSVSVTTDGSPVGIDTSGRWENYATNSSGIISIYRDGSQVGSTYFDISAAAQAMNASNIWEGPVTLSVVDSPPAGTHTYTVHVHFTASPAGGSITAWQPNIKVRGYKR